MLRSWVFSRVSTTGELACGRNTHRSRRVLPGARGQIYQVHFRNVSSPMPDFFETFPDDGYDIMKALWDAEFNGMVVPDHVPVCEESDATPQVGEAYSFG